MRSLPDKFSWHFIPADKNIAEFDLYLKHIKEESERLKQDIAKLDEMTTELNRLTRETGWRHIFLIAGRNNKLLKPSARNSNLNCQPAQL